MTEPFDSSWRWRSKVLEKELGAGLWVFRIYWLNFRWCFQITFLVLIPWAMPLEKQEAEEGRRSGMTMRRPEKILKITLATFGKRERAHQVARWNTFSMVVTLEGRMGPPSKSWGCEFRISKLPIANPEGWTIFWNDFFWIPVNHQKKSSTFFFAIFLQWFTSWGSDL